MQGADGRCVPVPIQDEPLHPEWSYIVPHHNRHGHCRVSPNQLSSLGVADAIVMQSIVGEEFAQGLYVADRAGFEPATLRTEGAEPYH